MPRSGYSWWHLVLTGRYTWLPGDRRGFRNREHRIHSSGDYKTPPPREEHELLREHYHDAATQVRLFDSAARVCIGEAMLAKLRKMNLRCLTLAVSPSHAHILVECEDDYQAAQRVASKLKQASSYAVRDTFPGKIWARLGKPIPIRDRQHHQKVFHYILNHARKEGAWTWKFDAPVEESHSSFHSEMGFF